MKVKVTGAIRSHTHNYWHMFVDSPPLIEMQTCWIVMRRWNIIFSSLWCFYSAPVGEWSIPISLQCLWVCVCICLSVCLSASISVDLLYRSSRNFVCRSLVAMARSSSGDVAIRYVLPVLWMTSHLAVIGHMAKRGGFEAVPWSDYHRLSCRVRCLSESRFVFLCPGTIDVSSWNGQEIRLVSWSFVSGFFGETPKTTTRGNTGN